MSDYRIIVTGSRDWPDPDAIRERLYIAASSAPRHLARIVVMHGASGRADHAARDWVAEVNRNHNYQTAVFDEPWPAKWAHPPRKGDPAGPMRNEAMAAKGADEALAFPWGDRRQTPGTWHCIEACATRGIRVHIFGRAR